MASSHESDADSIIKLKKLSRLNGEVNQMTEVELHHQLTSLDLNSKGTKEVMKKRLKDYYRRQKAVSKLTTPSLTYDYLCIIDFEATCEDKNPENYPHEIIEFPAVLLCTHNNAVVSEFHRYCRPVKHPILSEFCKTLTGITQNMVNSADLFPQVMDEFLQWQTQNNLNTKHKCAIVTDGPWDMERFLSRQCEISGIPYPKFARKWINIRKIYSNFYNCKRAPLSQMLEQLGMAFEGRQHCGLDDAKNITRIVVQLLKDGAQLRVNEWIHQRNKPTQGSTSSCQNGGSTINESKMGGHPTKQLAAQPKSRSQLMVSDGDLGVDPQITDEDLEELVAFRTSKKTFK